MNSVKYIRGGNNCTIRKGRQVVRDKVSYQIDIFEDQTWSGRLYPPNNTGFWIDEKCQMCVPDWLPVSIRITTEADEYGVVSFVGIGVPPVSYGDLVKQANEIHRKTLATDHYIDLTVLKEIIEE